jgi:predicted HTH transcriptional regulator
MKLIEAWGSGIQKIRDELDRYPEISLILKEVGNAFQVQFVKKEPDRAESGQSGAGTEVESLQQKVMSVLTKDALSKSEIAKKIGLKTVTGYFNRPSARCWMKGS